MRASCTQGLQESQDSRITDVVRDLKRSYSATSLLKQVAQVGIQMDLVCLHRKRLHSAPSPLLCCLLLVFFFYHRIIE